MMMAETKKQSQLQAMWFAAGTAAFMACLERAVLVSFVEQWRVVVFLALNLILLAILFTSPSSPPTNELESQPEPPTSPERQEGSAGLILEDEEMMKKVKRSVTGEEEGAQQNESNGVVVGGGHTPRSKPVKSRIRRRESQNIAAEQRLPKDDKAHELSKEEFNQRVEDFIATFRQHLASDGKGQSCRFRCSPAGDNHHRHGGIALRF